MGAFECLDENGSGEIDLDDLRDVLTTMGDRFTDEEVDVLYKSDAVDRKSHVFRYRQFVKGLKHGE
jgi:Ca2+-binding EF-hand superfamily protein